jgi:hypothetical protein
MRKKALEKVIEAFRHELLGPPATDARVAALEERMRELEQWPDRVCAALLRRALTMNEP